GGSCRRARRILLVKGRWRGSGVFQQRFDLFHARLVRVGQAGELGPRLGENRELRVVLGGVREHGGQGGRGREQVEVGLPALPVGEGERVRHPEGGAGRGRVRRGPRRHLRQGRAEIPETEDGAVFHLLEHPRDQCRRGGRGGRNPVLRLTRGDRGDVDQRRQ